MKQRPPGLAEAIHEYHRLQKLRSAASATAAQSPDAPWVRDVVHLSTKSIKRRHSRAFFFR